MAERSRLRASFPPSCPAPLRQRPPEPPRRPVFRPGGLPSWSTFTSPQASGTDAQSCCRTSAWCGAVPPAGTAARRPSPRRPATCGRTPVRSERPPSSPAARFPPSPVSGLPPCELANARTRGQAAARKNLGDRRLGGRARGVPARPHAGGCARPRRSAGRGGRAAVWRIVGRAWSADASACRQVRSLGRVGRKRAMGRAYQRAFAGCRRVSAGG